jgi:hypothetical protein
MHSSAHLIHLDVLILITLSHDYSSLYSFLQPPITSFLFDSNILLTNLSSNAHSLCPSLNVRDQVSHPHKTAVKIMVLRILIFTFLDSRQEDRSF